MHRFFRRLATRQGGGTLGGLLLGLVLGVLLSFGVVWYLNKTPLPFQNRQEQTPRGERPGGDAPQALPGKPGDKPVAERPRFEFYHILPGEGANGGEKASEGAASEKGTTKTAEKATATEKATDQPAEKPAEKTIAPVYLQAGAFQHAVDADNMKARLALMGVEASVQPVTLPEKGTVYRVRIGPFTRADELNRARTQLSQSGIEASATKATKE